MPDTRSQRCRLALFEKIAPGADIANDIPKYRVYENGVMTGEYTSVEHLWRDDFVSFLIGCSFSFESELIAANVPIRHIEEGRNVPMYLTNIECEPAGIFHGKWSSACVRCPMTR